MAAKPVTESWTGWAGVNNTEADPWAPGWRQRDGQQGTALAALREAREVMALDSGALRRRPGVALEQAMVEPRVLAEVGGRRLRQDGPVLSLDGVVLLEDLSAAVVAEAHAGRLFLTDNTGHWEVDAEGYLKPWGLPVPGVSLSEGSGGLAAGRYLVRVAAMDGHGNEGGASDLVGIEVADGAALVVSVSGVDAGHVWGVSVYVSPVNADEPTFVTALPVSEFPYTYLGARVTDGDPPTTALMTGPPAGIKGLVSFRAFLLAWRDGVAFRSEAHEPHLFHAEAIMQLPGVWRCVVALDGGLWIGTDRGLWWVLCGEDPRGWVPVLKHPGAVLGGRAVPAGAVGSGQGENRVALLVVDRYLYQGGPEGGLARLNDAYRVPEGLASAEVVLHEDLSGLRQIVVLGQEG